MKQEAKTILIPNATSPRNLGDLAMLSNVAKRLSKRYPTATIVVHSMDSTLHTFSGHIICKPSLYSWVAFTHTSIFARIWRLFQLLVGIAIYLKLAPRKLMNVLDPALQDIIADYQRATCILFAPGGYLRSQKGIKQSINLMMQCLPFWFAQKESFVLPCSIGPFAYNWQKKLVAKSVQRCKKVFVREDISLKYGKEYALPVHKTFDLAFLHPKLLSKKQASKQKILTLTLRKWFSSNHHQHVFESQVVSAVSQFAQKYDFVVKPIVQASAYEYGDIDDVVLLRVSKKLQELGVLVLPIERPSSLQAFIKAFQGVSLHVGMRMHSNIIAATQHVPFVALSYEYKTNGILADMKLSPYGIGVKDVSTQKLYRVLTHAWSYHNKTKQVIIQSIESFKKGEKNIWATLDESIEPTFTSLPSTPSVTVAVCAYNEEKNIKQFLMSVKKQQVKGYVLDEVLVISDGSTDKTVQVAKKCGIQNIRFIEHTKRKGKSTRLNELYGLVKSDILIQTDADIIFEGRSVFSELVSVFVSDGTVGMCGGNPMPEQPETFIEKAVNTTVAPFIHFRSIVRGGDNAFSVDGRLLAYRRGLFRTIHVPVDMIANDRFTYYCCLNSPWKYRFVPKAIVRFRSPQIVADHIRQNTRFLAAPLRMERYFSPELIQREEHIPLRYLIQYGGYQFIKYPAHMITIFLLNRYCQWKAHRVERKLTARWDMAYSTKQLGLHI